MSAILAVMRRLAITARMRGWAPEPSGEPPATDPQAQSEAIAVETPDGAPFHVGAIAYANHAVFTGPGTFTETGTVRLGDGDEIDLAAVGDGVLGPSADPDLLHGAVSYSVLEGRGRLAGATGLVTSNFLLRPAAGEFEERWVAMLFLP
jgi:hypothetical protein